MNETYIPVVMAALVLVASLLSIRFALSVAVVEIVVGVLAGNLLHMRSTSYIDFLAGFGGILLTFLAGAEVDTALLRNKLKESVLIGFSSFLFPFIAVFAYCFFVAGWDLKAAEIGATALSTTSLAVVYAVLVETGLTSTDTGKIIMAACSRGHECRATEVGSAGSRRASGQVQPTLEDRGGLGGIGGLCRRDVADWVRGSRVWTFLTRTTSGLFRI